MTARVSSDPFILNHSGLKTLNKPGKGCHPWAVNGAKSISSLKRGKEISSRSANRQQQQQRFLKTIKRIEVHFWLYNWLQCTGYLDPTKKNSNSILKLL